MRTLKAFTERLSRVGRHADISDIADVDVNSSVNQLRTQGFTILNHLVGSKKLKNLQFTINHKIQKNFDIEYPCLAQKKIDKNRDSDLIEKNFLVKNSALKLRGLTFDREDVESYQQMLQQFRPSTLKVGMPCDPEFYSMWLDPKVIAIVASYMGFYPHLTEAYIRRNFPCSYPVMNHNWHRDSNHDTHLLKAFIFFTDCDVDTGAHHYIAGSVNDARFRDKPYYTDDEINSTWPLGSDNHMISKVKAGTIIIEDTRGLHKAGIPKKAYRDLGFAIFLPPNMFRKSGPLYHIEKSVFDHLSQEQKLFIPSPNIANG